MVQILRGRTSVGCSELQSNPSRRGAMSRQSCCVSSRLQALPLKCSCASLEAATSSLPCWMLMS